MFPRAEARGLGRTMIRRSVEIRNKVGLHARPAAKFVEMARRFSSEIKVISNGGSADAKSILQVLALGVRKGTEITLTADGPDEEEALAALCALIEENFGETSP